MLGTFILSIGAGFLITRGEILLKSIIDRMTPNGMRLPPADFRVLALVALQGLVAILLLFMGLDSSLFMAAFGLGLGFFAPRIIAFVQDPDSVLGPSVWDQGKEAPGAPPVLPESNFDLDMETLRAVRTQLDSDPKT